MRVVIEPTTKKTAVVSGWILLGALAGCGLIPGDPFPSVYVVNRDEHIFVGDRCAVALPEVGVFVDGWSTTHGEARVRDSAWFARSDPSMVREFELFTNDQPGAQITKNGDRVENDASLNVETMDAQGRSGGISVVLGRTPPGYVNSPAGLMPWQEYMAMDDGDFGC